MAEGSRLEEDEKIVTRAKVTKVTCEVRLTVGREVKNAEGGRDSHHFGATLSAEADVTGPNWEGVQKVIAQRLNSNIRTAFGDEILDATKRGLAVEIEEIKRHGKA